MRKLRPVYIFGSILVIVLLQAELSHAQKFGYIDSNYVLSQMPEYAEANAEIDKLSKSWELEIQDMMKEIQKLEVQLKAEEVLLTKEMKDDRQKEINRKWDELKKYQNRVFGFDGLFFLKKKELIKPIQDQVFDAVDVVAKQHKLQIVFDKSGDLVMIYTDPTHDYTDYVLEELGLGDKNDVISNN